jgi:hypothetical protein
MDVASIVTAQWRPLPATALALFGLVLLGKGLWFGLAGSQGLLHERDALGWMRGFRLAVVGLCLFGVAIAWAWQVLWLGVAALGIVGEELLETSVIIEVLKRHPHRVSHGAHGSPARAPVRATAAVLNVT